MNNNKLQEDFNELFKALPGVDQKVIRDHISQLLSDREKRAFKELLNAAQEIDEANSLVEFRIGNIVRPVYSAMLREVWAVSHSKKQLLKGVPDGKS